MNVQNTIALSIHPLIKGKPAKDSHLLHLLGSAWENVEAEWPDAFELITVDGYATSAVLRDGRKSEENFISRQLVMIDIDGGMTVDELRVHELYQEFGAGFYATPSYTTEHPKFRILFRAESAIENADDYRRLTRSLLRVYSSADPSCKDACRLFYGTVDCQLKEMRDSVLPDDVIAILIEMDRVAQCSQQPSTFVQHRPIDDLQKAKIINLLCRIPVIPYDDWRTIAWGLKAGNFDESDFQLVTASTTGLTGGRTPQEARRMWNTNNGGKITMGSVIYIIKKHHGIDSLQENRGYGHY